MPQVEIVTGAASRIIGSLQAAIFSTMEAAAQGVEQQAKMAQAFQRLEAQEAILDWLIQRRMDQEIKLTSAELRPAQRALIEHKLVQIDEQLRLVVSWKAGSDARASFKLYSWPPSGLSSSFRAHSPVVFQGSAEGRYYCLCTTE